MPRETKAQKQARWEAEKALMEQEQAVGYFPRLMEALEIATTQENFSIVVRDGAFLVRDYSSYEEGATLTPEYSRESMEALEDFEYELQRRKEKRLEQERKAQVRSAALSKLTKEERELLGL